MGACLTVIKVVGTASLGLYAGAVATNLTTHDILVQCLTATDITTAQRANAVIKDKLRASARLLGALGSLATTAFLLAYTQAPPALKHPYLLYAALVAPISTAVYTVLIKADVTKYCEMQKAKKMRPSSANKQKKESLVSDLDNSVYKDLGDVLTTSDEDDARSASAAQDEDEEIEQEVELHLNQKTLLSILNHVHLGDKITSVLSIAGFVLATVGLYGDH